MGDAMRSPVRGASGPDASDRASGRARSWHQPSLRPEHDFERCAQSGPRGQLEGAADRGGARLDVLESLAGTVVARLEARSVVLNPHEPLRPVASDPDVRLRRARMLADVGEALLDDP